MDGIEEGEKNKLLPTATINNNNAYGGTTDARVTFDTENYDRSLGDDDDDDNSSSYDDFDEDDFEGRRSFHLGKTGLSRANILTSMRLTESFIEHGDEYDKVPSLLKENVSLVLDPNLDDRDNGSLYYSQSAFYKMEEEPEYVITVNCDIYQRILKEVYDSHNIPCGLYYCCHGGDNNTAGASGASLNEDDHVDIHLAWILLSVLFVAMFILSMFDV